MYLQTEFLLSLPLAVYALFRVRALLASRALRALWPFLFGLVVAGYPVAESLSHRSGAGWARAVVYAGYCALPLYLYIVMAVLLADAAVGLARLAGPLSRQAARTPRIRRLRLAVSVVLPVLAVLFGAVNHRVLRVREYRIEAPRRTAAARVLTVVFLADLHFRDLTSDRLLGELTAKVNARKPDLVLLGGDLLEGDRRGEDTGRYERALRGLSTVYGVFAVPGNHERFGRAGAGAFLERAGVRLLADEVVRVGDTLLLAGRKDSRSRDRKPVAELLADAPRDLPVILLSHRPKQFDEARAAGVDLQLSGHTHHGQLFPANFVTALQYDLSWGHLERGGAHLIVTSGVQGWGPPVRTVGASEIVVVRLVLE